MTVKILERIQTSIADLKGELEQMKGELEMTNARLGAIEMRLGTVERVLVTNVQEQRAATQFVKQLGHRVDELERDR